MEEGKAYIETGILELYVLGQLSAPEQKEVEAMAVKYPEVRAEISAIEIAMEQYALQHAITPSEGSAQKIFNKITENGDIAPEPESASLNTYNSDSKIRTLRFALAACIALLIVSVIALLSAHRKLNIAQDQIVSLTSEKQKFAATVSDMKNTNQELQKIADMTGDPSWAIVNLAGTKMAPHAKMMVYWNKKSRDVMVDNIKMALPANDTEHQYQLWALVNGKPVDLGVFDSKASSSKIMINMKGIPLAQAFAVTLEKRGGSISPTMDQMIVMGNVSI